MDWSALFGLTVSPLELLVRGSCIFWFLFAIFRFVLRREVGAVGVADVLVIVLIADASQNAMAGEYRSITDGLILISTIVFWNYLLDWLTTRSPLLAHWLEPPPQLLVSHGRMQRGTMRRELMSTDELMAKLREHGVDDLSRVKTAMLESNGEVSVVQYDEKADAPAKRGARKAV